MTAFLRHCTSVVRWVGDKVEVIKADETTCVAMAEPQVDVLGGRMCCLTRHDLTDYDYMSVRKDGFVPISIKQMMNVTQLSNDML
jgi:hypothetical protein